MKMKGLSLKQKKVVVIIHLGMGLKERDNLDIFLLIKIRGEEWKENEFCVVLIEFEMHLKF